MTIRLLSGSVYLSLALLSLSVTTIVMADSHDETVQVEEIPTGQPETSIADDASQAWDSTKKVAKKSGKVVNEKGTEVLDSTKVGIAKGADYVGEKSGQAWDATKQGAGKVADTTSSLASKAWNKTKQVTKQAVDYTSEKVGGLNESGETPQVEDKSIGE